MLHQINALLMRTASKCLLAATIFGTFSPIYAANPLSIVTSDPKPIVPGNRSVFMNGVDISSARNQDLRNVHIRISENGDIFITAPQYQVTEEETYTPLSSYTAGQGRPAHQPPIDMGATADAGKENANVLATPVTAPSGPAAKSAKTSAPSAEALPEKPASPTLLK